MKRLILCVALSLACSTGYSQTPAPSPPPPASLTISGNTTVPENGLVTLTATPSPSSVAWLVMPDVSQYTAGNTLLFSAPPGTYSVIMLAVAGGQPVIAKTTVTITSGSQATPRAIAIFDPATLTSLPAGQVAIYQSSTVASSVAALGMTWCQYQVGDQIPVKGGSGSAPVTSTKWGVAAAQVGYPALVLDDKGVVTASPLPLNQPILIQQLGTLTRGK